MTIVILQWCVCISLQTEMKKRCGCLNVPSSVLVETTSEYFHSKPQKQLSKKRVCLNYLNEKWFPIIRKHRVLSCRPIEVRMSLLVRIGPAASVTCQLGRCSITPSDDWENEKRGTVASCRNHISNCLARSDISFCLRGNNNVCVAIQPQ